MQHWITLWMDVGQCYRDCSLIMSHQNSMSVCLCVCKESVQGHKKACSRIPQVSLLYSPTVLKMTAQPTWRQPATSARCSSCLHRPAVACERFLILALECFTIWNRGVQIILDVAFNVPHIILLLFIISLAGQLFFIGWCSLFMHISVCGDFRCVRRVMKQ